MRPCPPLFSSLPPTIRAILARNAPPTPTTATTGTSSQTSESPDRDASKASKRSDEAEVREQDNEVSEVQEVQVHGWVKSLRAHKNVSFAGISDGSCGEVLQAVFKGENVSERITPGTSLLLRGQLQRSKGRGQAVELVVSDTKILGQCDPETYPIQKKHVPEHVLREQAHLRFKTTLTAATMRVRDALMRDWHDWFEENEFTHIHTPILTSSDCEGAGEVFRIHDPGAVDNAQAPTSSTAPGQSSQSTSPSSLSTPPAAPPPTPGASPTSQPSSPTPFFPTPTNLTVSSQLHLEAPTHALSRTYTLSPSFRSERSLTSRHLAEFYMLEGELAIPDLESLLDVVEDGIKTALRGIVHAETARGQRIRNDLAAINTALAPEREMGETSVNTMEQLRQAAERPFKRLTYTEAIEILRSHNDRTGTTRFGIKPEWGIGLSTEHEKFLADHFEGPTFITHYPAALKPFYMLPSHADPSWRPSSEADDTVACFDLLLPGLGELIGGSLREHRLPYLLDAISRAGLKEEEYEWYTDLRRFGSIPHGGWGMGWERWVCWITGRGNVRDVVAFPRWVGHCKY